MFREIGKAIGTIIDVSLGLWLALINIVMNDRKEVKKQWDVHILIPARRSKKL